MKKWMGVGWLLSLMLVACGGGGGTPQPQPGTTVLTEDKAWGGDAPADAQNLSNAEFEAKVKSGEITIASKKDLEAEEAAWRAQYEQDRKFLEGIPVGQRSPNIAAVLAENLDLPTTPGGDYIVEVGNADGSKLKTITLGKQSQMRQMVESYQQAGSPENALESYRAAFEASPLEVQKGLPAPDSLVGKSAAEILAVLYRLDDALAGVDNLDGTRAEDVGSGSSADLSALGNGVDTSGTCTPSSAGVYKNFWWPLKKFTTPVKQQGMRGTCWGFAAVAGLESREMVVNDKTLNLSEQFFVNKNKRNYAPSDFGDGYSGTAALKNFLDHGEKIPSEGAWTYNQAYGRPSNAFSEGVSGTAASYKGACNDYTGYCSESAHQSPRYCTKVLFFTICGYYNVTNGAGGVASSTTTNVWDNQWSTQNAANRRSHFPLNTVRALLAGGQALIGNFGIYKGFDGPAAGGFVTNFAKTDGRGGHVVLITGYVSNTTLASRLPNAPAGAGGGYFIIKNSWGCGAADAGYYYIPVDYITKFFSSFHKLNIGSARSNRWKSEVQQGKGTLAPTIKITAPTSAQTGDFLLPFYTNFKKNVTLTARADDANDGQDFTNSIDWYSLKQGKLGTGRSINVSLLNSGSSDTFTAKVKDSDGNEAQVSLALADTYPIVNIAFPSSGTALFSDTPYNLSASAEQFLGGNGQDKALPCSGLTWTSSKAGEGPWNGCTPSATFSSTGARTLSASYTLDGRTDTQSVTVQVSEAVPPVTTPVVVVTITKPTLPFVDGTYGSSMNVAFAAKVTVNGKTAQCSLLKWYRTAKTTGPVLSPGRPQPVGYGCSPTLNMPVGKWKLEAYYNDGNGAIGFDFGDVTINQKFVG